MDAQLPDWPDGLRAYKRTAEFDERTCPKGLRQAHSTKAGVWAKLHVLDGRLSFRDLESGRANLLGPGVYPVIFPQRLHEVEPVGRVRFFVEFHAVPDP